MTITLSDAALGLAEVICGSLMVGCVVVVLAYFVLDTIRDHRLSDRDAEARALREERDRLIANANVAEMEAAKWKRDCAIYRDQVGQAIAVLRGEDEEGDEETS